MTTERPAWMDDPSYVVRVAKQRRLCANCDDNIHVGERYFRMVDGVMFCCACPPDGVPEMCE